MPFIGKQSTSNSQITNYTTTVSSGGQTNFTVVIEGGDETHVYLNGVLLKETTDYTVSSTQVSLVSPAVENDIVEIKVFRSFALVDAVRASEGGTFSGDITVPNLIIGDGGNVGSASDTDAIVIASDGGLTFSGGIDNAGTISAGTIGGNVVFPAGMVLQTLSDNYNSQTGASSEVKVCEITFTTKKANSKLAYWFTTAIGGFADPDNVNLKLTLETGSSANSPSSSNYLPTDNRGPGTAGQNNGLQLFIDVLVESAVGRDYIINTYTASDLITTSYAKDTQITMGAFISGNCYINRSEVRANEETGITSLIVQEIAT